MKKILIAVACLQTVVALAAPTVERVVARQMWPWSTEIRIEYTLTGAAAPVDVELAFKNGEETLTVPAGSSAIQGDVFYVGNGLHVVTVDPIAAFGKGSAALADFKVKVTPNAQSVLPDNKVLYKIIDLEGATKGQVTDITRSELLLGKYGTVVTNYAEIGTGFSTPLANVIVWTAANTNSAFRTTKLLVRRIPAGEFMMGSPTDEHNRSKDPVNNSYALGETQHKVTLTKDYWIGVYPITQKQYKLIMETETLPQGAFPHNYTHCPDTDLHPVYDVQYTEHIRGKANWPANHDVTAGSFLGKLRALVSNQILFDLPTEAQWERACRGGNEGADVFYSGKLAYVGGSLSSANRNEICCNYYNSKDPTVDPPDAEKIATVAVGSKLPNAFGLYDMIGNVGEWCLDRCKRGQDYDLVNTTDPVGFDSTTGDRFVVRGGAVNLLYGVAAYLRSASRVANSSYIYEWSLVGFRVSWTEE